MRKAALRGLGSLIGFGLLVGLSGCSSGSAAPTRSVANFCSTYRSEKAQFEQKYASVSSMGPHPSGTQIVTALVLGLQSLGDASVILDKLDRVAPSDIEPDVAAVRDSWKQMQATMGDEASNALNPKGMVGAMLKGLLGSMESQGSWDRLGNYIQHNCSGGA